MVYQKREKTRINKSYVENVGKIARLDIKIKKAKDLCDLEHKKLNEKKLKDAKKIKAKLIKKIKKGIKTLINDSSKRDMEDLKNG